MKPPVVGAATEVLSVEERDFRAVFDGQKGTVSWNWLKGEPELTNKIDSYPVPFELREKFNAELDNWVRQGWLQPIDEAEMGLIPLLAVSQPIKEKVRPVLHYCELNSEAHHMSHSYQLGVR